jgi:cyclopropane-fatty-acyl-phospholipid synthase
MVYSCAYFNTPEDDLDAAQLRKLDYICRKLRLRAGERFLDVGCGWGGLILHAAKYYNVDALGITLSAPQAEVASERIRRAGLESKCRVTVCDYRELAGGEPFDKIASVGMFEHVGEKLLSTYFSQAWQLLKPGGVLLNHGISYSATYHRRGPSFIDRYVFPDADLVPVSSSLQAAENSGFEVRDVESLREHYALTLRRWVRRLEDQADEARRITNDATYRIWRIYLAGSAHGFCSGRLNVYQTLLSKPSVRGQSGLPLTREDWYRDKLASSPVMPAARTTAQVCHRNNKA